MAPRYRVTLIKEERKDLETISTKRKRAARTVLYARSLLLLDAGELGPKWVVAQVAEGCRSSGDNDSKHRTLKKTIY